jgi:hypothetical protein
VIKTIWNDLKENWTLAAAILFPAFFLIWLGVSLFSPAPKTVEAQAPQPVQQLLDVESFNLTWANSPTVFSLRNLGQAGHSLMVLANAGGGPGCSIQMQGSGDKTNWTTLAVLPNPAYTSPPVTIFAAGNLTYFQIVANPNSTVGCASGAHPPPVTKLYYVGYQFPASYTPGSENFKLAVSTVVSAYPDVADLNPYQAVGIQCYNPNNSLAYLQMFDASSTPTLGSGLAYEVGIAANSLANLTLNNWMGRQHLYLGAATAAGGSTAVSTALTCNLQVNRRGPFGSFGGN